MIRLKASLERQIIGTRSLSEIQREWNEQIGGVVRKVHILLVEIKGMRPDINSIWRHMDDQVP